MQHRRIWVALGAVALLCMGFSGGMFFSRPGHHAMMQLTSRLSCASSRQFIVEFRVRDMVNRSANFDALQHSAELEVDGERLGWLSYSNNEQGLRRFLCEGNHIAQFTVQTGLLQNAAKEVHRVEFAVSRPSLFHAKEWPVDENEHSTSCVSGDPCRRSVELELSPYEPDDPKVRIFPSEPQNTTAVADEERYMTEIPGEPLEYFLYERRPCVIYEENGVRKAARFEPPDRFHPVDPWILDWGDIAGVAYAQPISEYSFALYVALDRQDYEAEKTADAESPDAESPE